MTLYSLITEPPVLLLTVDKRVDGRYALIPHLIGVLRDNGLETAVADRIESFGLQDLVLISSFSPFSVRRARKVFSRSVPIALIRAKGIYKYTYLIASEQADNPHHALVNEKYIAWAKKRGYRIHAWTVDDPGEASRLAGLGVHGIITNKPQIIREHLKM